LAIRLSRRLDDKYYQADGIEWKVGIQQRKAIDAEADLSSLFSKSGRGYAIPRISNKAGMIQSKPWHGGENQLSRKVCFASK